MIHYVKCAKCGTFGQCAGHDGTFIPRTPEGWIGLHAVQPELNIASDFLGFVCLGCKADVLGAIKAILPHGEA